METGTIAIRNGLEIGDAGSKGLGLFASQKLSPRDVIHTIHEPAIIAISTSELPHICYNCYAGSQKTTEDSYSLGQYRDAKLQVCTGCRLAHFCGKSCQTKAWKSFHKYECKKFAKWTPRLSKPFSESARAIIRFILQHHNGLLPDGLWDRVLSLESHIQKLRQMDANALLMVKASAEALRQYTDTDVAIASVTRLSLVLRFNAMVLTTTCGEEIGVFLDPVFSRMNHSCDGGNVVIHRPVYTNLVGWSLETTPTRPMMKLFPVREIAEDEELTITYIDRRQGVYERRESLQDVHDFTCDCGKCRSEIQALDIIKREDSFLFQNMKQWSKTFKEQKSRLEAGEPAPQTLRSVIASLESIVTSVKSRSGFTVDWFPYPQAVNELRLAHMDPPASYDKAFLYALEEYFIVGPAIYPYPLDPSRTIQAMFLIELLGLLTDTFYSSDTAPEPIKQREAIEKRGFTETSFVYWYFRICKDVRSTLLQSAALDLADVLLKLQTSAGMPLEVAEKLLRDAQVQSKAEDEMRGLLGITKERWNEISKK